MIYYFTNYLINLLNKLNWYYTNILSRSKFGNNLTYLKFELSSVSILFSSNSLFVNYYFNC